METGTVSSRDHVLLVAVDGGEDSSRVLAYVGRFAAIVNGPLDVFTRGMYARVAGDDVNDVPGKAEAEAVYRTLRGTSGGYVERSRKLWVREDPRLDQLRARNGPSRAKCAQVGVQQYGQHSGFVGVETITTVDGDGGEQRVVRHFGSDAKLVQRALRGGRQDKGRKRLWDVLEHAAASVELAARYETSQPNDRVRSECGKTVLSML